MDTTSRTSKAPTTGDGNMTSQADDITLMTEYETPTVATDETNIGTSPGLQRPPPPNVGKVTHHSVELIWDEALRELNAKKKKGDGRVKVCTQEEDKGGKWGNVYTGYGKKNMVEGLEPNTKYRYRMRFNNTKETSDWSPVTIVSTTKEPLCAEHLNIAVQRRDYDEIERILNSGDVNVDTPDKLGFTALMHACQKGYREIAETLIKNGADVNMGNESGKTAMMMATFAGKLDCVRLLRANGGDYHKADKGGSTAIHWAVDGGNADLLYWILEDGAEVDIRDVNSGWTPLIRCASVSGNYEVASCLLNNSADINAQDNDGKTTLMVAVINGHIQLLELLLQRGADLLIKNMFGKTAYEMALTMDRRRIIKLVEEHCKKKGIKMR